MRAATRAGDPRHMLNLAERWLSGRKHRTRNAAYGQPYRGFESHPLRQGSTLPLITVVSLTAESLHHASGGGDAAHEHRTVRADRLLWRSPPASVGAGRQS